MIQFLVYVFYLVCILTGVFFAYVLLMLVFGLINRHAPTHRAVRSYVDPDDDNIYREAKK